MCVVVVVPTCPPTLFLGQSDQTVNRTKRAKYKLLVLIALREAGWNVVETVHVITVGVRGRTVPLANRAELGCLVVVGITTKKEQLPAQRAMASRKAIKHLNIIVHQYRKLSGRRGIRREGGGTRSKPDQGPPCATIPPRLLGS
eukprot:6785074-Pyramimonas_sp.AAC.3